MIKISLSRFKVLVKNVQYLKCENVTLSGFKLRFSPIRSYLVEKYEHITFGLSILLMAKEPKRRK